MTRQFDYEDYDLDRRTVLKSAATASAFGLVGGSAFTGSALAEEHPEIDECRLIDIYCAIDTSGSLNPNEIETLQTAVNDFIDAIPTDGSTLVGTLEFGNKGVRNNNVLQNPTGLTVNLPSSGSGNTPMPGALDIADQAVWNDSAARSNALKLVVLFTDGGPNYKPEVASYSLGGYNGPRDDSEDWSWVGGNSYYDNGDTTSSTVSEPEMDETALIASSVKEDGIGDGETLVATVFASDQETDAMTSNAISAYTDLPTYLANYIATSSDFAIDADPDDVDSLVEQLVAILDDLCDTCVDCDSDDLLAKYEFECSAYDLDEEEEEVCVDYDFDLDGDGDENISYSMDSFESKEGEENEPVSVTFATDYCTDEESGLWAVVKAGQDFIVQQLTVQEGQVTVTNGESKHAISFVAFFCTEVAAEAYAANFPSNGAGGRGSGRGGGN